MNKIIKSLVLIISFVFFGACGGGNNGNVSSVDEGGVKTEGITLRPQALEGDEIQIAVGPADQKNAHVVYLRDKDLWFVAYEDWSNGHADIKGMFVRSDGTLCGGVIDITTDLGNQTFPRVAYRDGGFMGDNNSILAIVWQDLLLRDSASRNAYIGLRAINISNIDSNCGNLTFSNIIPIPNQDRIGHSGQNRQAPKIDFNPSQDRFVLAWIETDTNNKTIRLSRIFNDPSINADFTYRAYNYIKIIEDLDLNNVSSININSNQIRTLPPIQKEINIDPGPPREETRTYTILCSIQAFDFKCDDTTNECLFALSGTSGRLELTYSATGPTLSKTEDCESVVKIHAIYKTRIHYTDDPAVGAFVYSVDDTRPDFEPMRITGALARNPSVGFGRSNISGGGYLIVWEDLRDSSENPKVFGQLILSSRGLVGGNIRLSPDAPTDTKQTQPYVSFDLTNERFFVVWTDSRNGSLSTENLDIYGQYVNMDGTLSGSNHQLTGNPANQYSPTIAYNSFTKMFLFVWNDARDANTNNADVYGQRFTLGMPQIVILDENGNSLEPSLLDFGTLTVGESNVRSIKIRNVGDAVLRIDCLEPSTLTSPFSYSSSLPGEILTCGDGQDYTLEPNTEFRISIKFEPSDVGSYNASFLIRSNTLPKQIRLQGEAVAPAMTILVDGEPLGASINFGNVQKDTTSQKTISIVNSGTVAYRVTNITGVSSPFSITGFGPSDLNPGESLTFTLTYAPTERGTHQVQMEIQTDVALSRSVTVEGRAIAPVLVLSATSINFGQVGVGTTQTQTVTIRNEGDATLVISRIEVVGEFYSVDSSSTATMVNPGNSTTFTVSYRPGDLNSHTGTVRVVTNAGTTDIALEGSGRGGKVKTDPVRLDFGTIPTNSPRTLSLTITNTGNDNLNITGITSNNPVFSVSCSGSCPTNTSPVTLIPNASYTVNVSINTSVEGANTGVLTIANDGVDGNVQIDLYAVAVEPRIEISPSSSIDFGYLSTNEQSTRKITLSNTGTIEINIQYINQPQSPFQILNPPPTPYTLRAGESIDLLVAFSPTTAGEHRSMIALITDVFSAPIQINLRGTAISTDGGSGRANIGVFDEDTLITTYAFPEDVLIGNSQLKSLNVKKILADDIKIVRVVSSKPEEFIPTIELNRSIPPEGLELKIAFVPKAEGFRNAEITLVDNLNNELRLTVQGYGTRIKLYGVEYAPSQVPIAGKPANVFPLISALITNVNPSARLDFEAEVYDPPQSPKYYLVYNNLWEEISPTSSSGSRSRFSVNPGELFSLSDGSISLQFVVARESTLSDEAPSVNPPPQSSAGSGGGCSMVYGSSHPLNALWWLLVPLMLLFKRLRKLW